MSICNICGTWGTDNLKLVLLLGHNPSCPNAGNLGDAYEDIILALLAGIDNWASDEDGVHPECWDAYKKASQIFRPSRIIEEAAS